MEHPDDERGEPPSQPDEEVGEEGAGGLQEALHRRGDEHQGERNAQDGVQDREELTRACKRSHVAVACKGDGYHMLENI